MHKLRSTVILVLVLLNAMDVLATQLPADPAAAPVPAPIFTAKKVFISNASLKAGLPAGTPELTYNEFYAAMKTWGRYEIVSAPIDADLVFEIRFTFVVGPSSVYQGIGGSSQDFQFQVVIRDSKSQVGLWAFSESVKQDRNALKGRKYFDEAMAALLDDVKKLVPSQSSDTTPK